MIDHVTKISREQYTDAISETDLNKLLRQLHYTVEKGIAGDVIEMGCWRGGTTVAMGRLLRDMDSGKEIHVYDSFEGLPRPTEQDGQCVGSSGSFSNTSPEVILSAFSDRNLSPPTIHKGWFRDIKEHPDAVCFAFLDGDLYESILDSLEVVWPLLSSGGIAIVHDYCNANYPGAMRACNDFFNDKKYAREIFGDLGIFVKKAT